VTKKPDIGNLSGDQKEAAANTAFGQLLEAKRKAAKLTQVQLAELSGISQSHISHLEIGRLEPRLNTIIALADALQIDTAALIPGPASVLPSTARPPPKKSKRERVNERLAEFAV